MTTFPTPDDVPSRSKGVRGVGAPPGGPDEPREFPGREGLFVAPNTGKLSLKLQLDPRPRAAWGHADDLGVVSRTVLGGRVPMVLIIRRFLAVKPHTGRSLQRRLLLLLLRLPPRSAGRGKREKPRVGAAREYLRSGNLAVDRGPKGGALQGSSKGICS